MARPPGLSKFYEELNEHIKSLEEEEPSSDSDWSKQAANTASLSATFAARDSSTIFDDAGD